MRIAIIGGGLTGLVAGFRLSPNHKITIFEKNNEAGGLLSSYHKAGYTIECFYHHFFSGDRDFLQLIKDLGISEDVLWLKGSTGTYVDGKIVPLTTPLEIIRYPYLSFVEKVKLALFTKRAKNLDPDELDLVSAESYIIEHLGEEIYSAFFKPLLISKFGKNAKEISAAWLISRVAIRSDRGIEGERLGYLKGGFSTVITRLTSQIENFGGDIRYDRPVVSLINSNSGWNVNGEEFDAVISTIAPRLMEDLGVTTCDIPYQGAACLTVGLKRQVTNGIYWINLYDDASYGAVIGHTCFAPFDWYHEHIVYLASYFTGEVAHNLKEVMLKDFCNKFKVGPEEINWAELTVDPYAGPLYITGYKSRLKTQTIPRLFVAGMHSPENYPERSIEGCVRAGLRIADEVKDAFFLEEVIV